MVLSSESSTKVGVYLPRLFSYATNCREEVFSETEVPIYGVPGNLVSTIKGFPETQALGAQIEPRED